jgi:glucose-6-phosphate 1-dehydrogenase
MGNFLDEACLIDSSPMPTRPMAIVIFGATGDLTHRKVIPAFYHLQKNGQLPEGCCIIGFARRPKSDEEFRAELRAALDEFSHTKPVDEKVWESLSRHIYYQKGDLDNTEDFHELGNRLRMLPESKMYLGNFLFYLATAPSYFGTIAENLAKVDLAASEQFVRRLIVEKPFGEDLASAQELNNALYKAFPEKDIFRIDHYLGKETVQNLLYFRFGNSIYEPLWNRRYIDNIQITVAEKVGVGSRGGYYDHSGAARDMLQNHLTQLLSLIAMEPPASLDADSIHDEKCKVLRSIPIDPIQDVLKDSVRAQYTEGMIDGKPVKGYLQEDKVSPHSLTETYVAWRLEIDNWRWSGVPFYLRTGKAMTRQFSEINIIFNRPPSVLFAAVCGTNLRRNCLRIRIQPNEGIHLNFNAKVPGKPMIQLVDMDFKYRENPTHYLPEAYERLLLDSMTGESTLFTRRDEVEHAWSLVDNLRKAWDGQKVKELPIYRAGSMGPTAADQLLEREGRRWVPLNNDS